MYFTQPFPISPRNTPEAIANLLSKTGCHDLVVSHVPSIDLLVERTLELLSKQSHSVHIQTVPSFNQLYPTLGSIKGDVEAVEPYPIPSDVDSLEAVRIYFHSSGTTSLPKPIPINEEYFRFTCYHSTGKNPSRSHAV